MAAGRAREKRISAEMETASAYATWLGNLW